MRNPAIAIICGACRVAIQPVLHPSPETQISCPQCGAADTYSNVTAICMEEVKDRFGRARGADLGERPRFAWQYRDD